MNTKNYVNMNTKNYAESEIDILLKEYPDSIIADFKEEILFIFDKFMHKELSGASAPYYRKVLVDTIDKLLRFEPISPITGKDEEWVEIAEENDKPLYQNKRLSTLFKTNGKCHYIDAIVFKNQNGLCFTSYSNKVTSRQPVNRFPFVPKTFIVDVIDNEDNTGFHIVDESQVQDALNYYK